MKDKFTIFTPVRDRQYNINRLSNYYKDVDCRKIICDSSVSPYDNVEMLEERGFEYHYFGPMTYWEKMYRSVNLIETPYMIDNPDDDLTIRESIEPIVKFLSENEDYSGGQGEVLTFTFKNKKIKKETKFFEIYASNLVEDFRSNDPIERLYHHFRICPGSFNHIIMKSSVLQEIFTNVYKTEKLQNVRFTDRLVKIILALRGNIKYLPILFTLKQRGEERVSVKNPQAVKELNKNRMIGYPGFLPTVFNPMIKCFALEEHQKEIHKIINVFRRMSYYGKKDYSKIKSNINNFNYMEELKDYLSN